MRWYWLVSCDNAVPDPLVVNASSPEIDRDSLVRGSKVEGWNPENWLQASSIEYDGQPDDALQNHLSLPIFSGRLKRGLEQAGVSGLQYLPVKVLRPNGSVVGDFYIANILAVVSALDRERSDLSVNPPDYFLESRRGAVSAIRKAVLISSRLSNQDVIRLAEFPEAVYVGETFRRVFGGMTGASFQEVALSHHLSLV